MLESQDIEFGTSICYVFYILKMKGSTVAAASRLQTPTSILNRSKSKLAKYDQQHFYWGRCIGSILSRPNSFIHQRKCQEEEQWMEKYFDLNEATKEINELIEYYRFYKNSPTLAHTKYLDFMGSYWNKKKSLYYRGIKRQLQIQDQLSQESAQQHIQQLGGRYSQSLWTGTFQLPSQFNPSDILQADPDATICRLLFTMSAQKQHKSTRQVSKIAQFQQKSAKPHLKSHMKTNPSQLVSTSEFKKSKKKIQHKSMSNQPKTSQNKKSLQKKLNPTASCHKIGLNQPEFQLNYQRRNKQKEGNKESNKKRISNTKQMVTNKKKQVVMKKGKSGQKSISVLVKSKSGRKSKQIQTSANVKAVIDRVKDKIKAQKSVMMKKYIQSRQSCKSNDSTRGDTVKRFHK